MAPVQVDGRSQSSVPVETTTALRRSADGPLKTFAARVRIDTPVEMDYYRNGGILQTVLRKLLAG